MKKKNSLAGRIKSWKKGKLFFWRRKSSKSKRRLTQKVRRLFQLDKNELFSQRWFVPAVALFIYFLGLGGMLVVIYSYKINSVSTRLFLTIYPLPAAVIDYHSIPVREVFKRMNYSINFNLANHRPLENEAELRQRVLNQLIDDYLYQLGAQKINLTVTPADIQQAYNKIIQENGGEEEVRNAMESLYKMTLPEFKQLIKIQVLKDKIKNESIEQVKVRHILVADEKTAQEVAEKLKNKEDFGELAKKYSKDENSRQNGGELGWVQRGDFNDQEFEKKLFSLQVGADNLPPFKTSYGWHIVKIEDKKGTISLSLDEWLNELRKTAKIWRLLK